MLGTPLLVSNFLPGCTATREEISRLHHTNVRYVSDYVLIGTSALWSVALAGLASCSARRVSRGGSCTCPTWKALVRAHKLVYVGYTAAITTEEAARTALAASRYEMMSACELCPSLLERIGDVGCRATSHPHPESCLPTTRLFHPPSPRLRRWSASRSRKTTSHTRRGARRTRMRSPGATATCPPRITTLKL